MTRARERVLEVFAAAALTAVLLYPISRHPGTVARIDSSDGQFSLWNVAWVARTIVADPPHLFDANIFYPHRGALLYSEANLVAGVLAVPAYWATRNPYLAHNTVVLFAFFLSALATYWLVRGLTGNRWAGAVAGICFAFAPHLFSHTTHIQLLMTPGIPLSMLAFHRLTDRPTLARGAALGAAMALTALSCAYYGIFAVLLIGLAVLVTAGMRGTWTDRAYWSAIGVAAVVAVAIVLPLFIPYAMREQAGGFNRSLNEARRYSGDWHSYLTSAARAHSWMLPLVRPWVDAAFPGFVATGLGLGRLITAPRLRGRAVEIVAVYGAITIFCFWASLGPDAGLYSLLYTAMPGFSLMRAPVRFALPVAFGLSVLAGFAVQALLARAGKPAVVGAILVALAIADHSVALRFPVVQPPSPGYEALARVPPGPVIEMPFFERPAFYSRHTIYMLMSTLHWLPLVNGYSDHFPPTFEADARDLASFPFPPAFATARRLGVRYAMFHLNVYDAKTRAEVEERLLEYAPFLRPLYVDADTRLYEIAEFP